MCTDIKAGLQVYRARFSEITGPSVFRALNNLERPNKNISDAVDVRQELDLRTGLLFTKQTNKKSVSFFCFQAPHLHDCKRYVYRKFFRKN